MFALVLLLLLLFPCVFFCCFASEGLTGPGGACFRVETTKSLGQICLWTRLWLLHPTCGAEQRVIERIIKRTAQRVLEGGVERVVEPVVEKLVKKLVKRIVEMII